MKSMKRNLGLVKRLSVAATALLLGQHALAAGTDPGTDVDNTATVSYSVNSVGQTDITASVSFEVDRRVDFTVTRINSALTPIGVDEQDAFIDFYVTNTSNGVLDFNLAAVQLADGTSIYTGGTDTTAPAEDVLDVRVRVSSADDGGTPGSGPDPLLTDDADYIDDLAEDESIRVRVYVDGPLATANGEISALNLEVRAADPAGTVAAPGANLVETPGVDDPTLVENVFADDGATGDNLEFVEDGFVVNAAQLVVTKAVAVVSDPFGSGKAVPGAVLEYTITLDNSAGTDSADGVSIGDPIDIDVTFDDDAYDAGNGENVSFDSGTSFCVAETTGTDDNGDGCVFAGGALSIAGRDLTGTAIDVAAGATVTVSFRVEIPTTP